MENLKAALAYFDIVTLRDDDSKNQVVEQFVQDVIDFSSQYGSDISVSYSALNLSGKPSNFPNYGDFPQACVTRTYGTWWADAPSGSEDYQPQNNGKISSSDFVELQFQRAVFPIGIKIYEVYNPGAVVRIWAKGRDGWTKLWEGEHQTVGHTSRLFQPNIRRVNFKTSILRIELNQSHLPYYTELDAVMLEGTLKWKKETEVYSKKEDLSRILSDDELGNIDVVEKVTDDLMSRVIALGLHTDLITSDVQHTARNIFNEDLCKMFSVETTLMGNFHSLPDETILKIFCFLDLQSLSRCAQVNRNFNRLARDPLLYKSINLKPYWYCVDEYVLKTIASRATLLQKIDLSWCGNQDVLESYDLAQLIQCCGHTITHLRLDSCGFVDYVVLKSIAESCTNLREISLRSCGGIIKSGFVFLSYLKNLTRLDLYRTLIEKPALLSIIRGNKNLQHINLGSCGYISSMDEVAIEIGKSCPNLVSIDLWKTYSLTLIGVRALINCTKLQEVDFGWCLQVGSSGEWVAELARACPRLKKLYLGALRAVSDRDLRPLPKLCPELEQLDLFGVRAITSDICEQLLMQCGKLRLLDISFCDQIVESQIKAWRENFPLVSIKRTFVPESSPIPNQSNF